MNPKIGVVLKMQKSTFQLAMLYKQRVINVVFQFEQHVEINVLHLRAKQLLFAPENIQGKVSPQTYCIRP